MGKRDGGGRVCRGGKGSEGDNPRDTGKHSSEVN